MKNKIRKNNTMRLIFQAISFAFHNGYVRGWVKDGLYTGNNKVFCVPGLNCYSCPGAVGSCPIGSLQAVLDSGTYKFSIYVLGFIGLVGVLCGRLVCGWLCPFGFVQDLLYRIPIFKKGKTLPGHKYLKWLKYVILGLFVILLPMVVMGEIGMGKPWFCEWICPSGTLFGGIPQILMFEDLRAQIGFRFAWKCAILLAIIILSIKLSRPFCKYVCPLGALYGLCNPVSTYRLKIDSEKCVQCGTCNQSCPMDINTWKTPNSLECIRCGKCMAACPTGAISSTWNDMANIIHKQKQETPAETAEEATLPLQADMMTDAETQADSVDMSKTADSVGMSKTVDSVDMSKTAEAAEQAETWQEPKKPGKVKRIIAAVMLILTGAISIFKCVNTLWGGLEGIHIKCLFDMLKQYIYCFPCIVVGAFMIVLAVMIFRSLKVEEFYEEARVFSVRTFWVSLILSFGLNYIIGMAFMSVFGGFSLATLAFPLYLLVGLAPVIIAEILVSLIAMKLMKTKTKGGRKGKTEKRKTRKRTAAGIP